MGCGDPATNDSIPVVSNNSIVANKDASGRRLLGTPVDVYANCTGMYPSKGAMYGALALFILVLVLWAFVGECMPRRKMAAGNAMLKAADVAFTIYGGFGGTQRYVVERYYRDAKIWSYAQGSPEIMTEIVARNLLKREVDEPLN